VHSSYRPNESTEQRDARLCTELESLQARALHRVEELENDFHGTPLLDETKTMFLTMQRLITKV
jgi:hypothetical protein